MPNKKNALKALRQTKKRTVERLRAETHLESLIHSTKKMITGKKIENPKEIVRSLQQALDKAGKKNIISKNKARRLKSHFGKQLLH